MACTHTVRILPLGDSLTQGDGNPSAYRYHLFRLLTGAGIPFRFVGGVCGGDWRLPPECRYHSSRGGITSEGLMAFHTEGDTGYVASWAEAAREAEVALLAIGTNDAHRGLPLETYTERVDKILDILYGYNPNLSTVFIATMRSKWKDNARMLTMNAALLDPAFAASQAARGRDVRVIDFNGEGTPENLPSDYPPDDGHPNESGNCKLAEIWFAGIEGRIRELSETLSPADATPLPSILCRTESIAIPVGSGERLVLSPAPGGEVSYLFESDNREIAEVDEDGTVYGVREGECTVLVRSAYRCTPVAKVKVTVAGRTADVLDDYPIRHTPEPSEEGYTAPEKALRPSADGLCVRYPHWTQGEIVSRECYPQDSVCLAFEMTAVSAFPAESVGQLTLSLGNTSLTFREYAMRMTLSAGGQSTEIFDPTPPYNRRPMRLVREGDRVTLLRGGVVLATLSGVAAPTGKDAPLRIDWKGYNAMIHYFYGLTVARKG